MACYIIIATVDLMEIQGVIIVCHGGGFLRNEFSYSDCRLRFVMVAEFLDKFGSIWMNLDIFGYVWIYLDIFGYIWIHLDILDQFGYWYILDSLDILDGQP